MAGRAIVKSIALAFVVLMLTGLGSQASASFDFELTGHVYAMYVWYWYPTAFESVIENTGSEADTIDLVLTKNFPGGGWFGDICVGGVCIPDPAIVVLDPGQVEDLSVEMFVGPSQGVGEIILTATSRGNPANSVQETYTAFAGVPSIMLVDDDNGADYETYMLAAIDSAGYEVRHWDADSLGRPGEDQLNSYWAVMWTTADGSASYITGADEQDMMTYLDNGGNLFLSSMGFLTSRGAPTTFITDYLHIGNWSDDVGGLVMNGVSGDPISDGMNLSLVSADFPPAGVDTFATTADLVFKDQGNQGPTGMKTMENGHKVAFFAYPFETVPTSGPDPDNQKTLISRIIEWFDVPTTGVDDPQVLDDSFILRQNSPNPFAGSTTISFAVPNGARQAGLEVFNVRGQVVRTLDVSPASGTTGSVTWDGRDNTGNSVASGVYFYKLSVDGRSAIRSMVHLK